MVSVLKHFGWMNSAEDSGIADGTDDAPKLRALMDRQNTDSQGGVVVLQKTTTPYQFDTTIEVKSGEEFVVPAGVRIETRTGEPAFRFVENYANVTGRGLITATAGSPNGIVQFGDGANNALWGHLHRLRLRGDSSAGSVGVHFVTPPAGVGNYWHDINDVHIERVENGVHTEPLANAQKFNNVDFQRITRAVFWLESDESQINGGSVHFSSNVIVHDIDDATFNISLGLVAEAGGTASWADLDANTANNWIQGIANVAGGITDNGARNTVITQNRMDFGAARVGFFDQTPVTQPATNADIHTTGLAAGA